MQTARQNRGSATAAEQVDLMPYINALIDRWWLPVLVAIASACLVAFLTWDKPYLYQSGVKVSIVDIEDPGGVSPDDRRASEVLTLVEHGFVMGTTHDNYDDVMLARLRSRKFTMRFLEQNNIARYFYPEYWRVNEQRWVEGFEPDRGEVFTRFITEVRGVVRDEETDIVTVIMKWPEPSLARDWANAYVVAFNEYIRERTMNDVRLKQEFLNQELRRSDVLEIQQSIYRLIEAQTAIAMLASAREEYALEIIDPAALAYQSISMSHKKKIAVGFLVGGLLAVFAILAWVLLRGLLETIRALRAGPQTSTLAPAQ